MFLQLLMKKIIPLLLLVMMGTMACTRTYYVVRHAEKNEAATGGATTPNTPLSETGQARANALRDTLASRSITYVFTTNTVRTRSTGRPTALAAGADTLLYSTHNNDTAAKFFARLKKLKKNTLIVGHSNTVNDIVNALSNAQNVPNDIPDSQYDNLFIIRYSKFLSTKIRFTHRKYGAPTP
jgi:broad specificity phosphatase PhoE